MAEEVREQRSSHAGVTGAGRLGRLLKVLTNLLRDNNLRSSLKSLFYHLGRLEEPSPRRFSSNIAGWAEHLCLVQTYYQDRQRASDERIVDLYPDLHSEIARTISHFQLRPIITILVPVLLGSQLELQATLESLREQFYSNLEISILAERKIADLVSKLSSAAFGSANSFRLTSVENLDSRLAESLDCAVHECRGEIVGFLSGGDRLSRNALFEVVKTINQHPDASVVYSDEEVRAGDYFASAFHKPDWSQDLFLSKNYLRNFLCCRTEAIRAAGGLKGVAEDDIKYDLVLRLIEGRQQIHHVPRILYHEAAAKNSSPHCAEAVKPEQQALKEHLKRVGIKGTVSEGVVTGTFRVRREVLGNPLVTIIIPTKDKVALLKRCIESIHCRTSYRNYEIVVVDNASSEPESLTYLERLPHRVIRFAEVFNFSKINNLAAASANGRHLLFLNNDTEVIAHDWLEAMLEHSQRWEVGAVGAKLLYPNGMIQHAGIVLEPEHVALHVHRFRGPYDHGYHGLADVIRNLNAVTGACLMIEKSLFNELGGFDESLPITFNDIDLCLKARARGLLVVYTPFALLYHREGISKITDEKILIESTASGRRARYQIAVPQGQSEQIKHFYSRWKDYIENDSYYVAEELT